MEEAKKIFSQIYDKYIDKIYRFVFFKVNSQEIAQDLTSETFMRTWGAFQVQKIDNAGAFLYKTARNLVTDYYREKGKNTVVSAEDASIIDPRQNLEEQAILDSDMESVMKAMSELKEDYQNAITWRYVEDLSISEVAMMLGKTEDNTRVLLHRALGALKGKLKEIQEA